MWFGLVFFFFFCGRSAVQYITRSLLLFYLYCLGSRTTLCQVPLSCSLRKCVSSESWGRRQHPTLLDPIIEDSTRKMRIGKLLTQVRDFHARPDPDRSFARSRKTRPSTNSLWL